MLANRLLSFNGLSCPTTCAYQFVQKDASRSDLSLEQFFTLDSLGLAMEIHDGTGHSFMASAFSHATCIALVKSGGELIANNEEDECVLFAWGASGGSKETRAGKRKTKRQKKRKLRK